LATASPRARLTCAEISSTVVDLTTGTSSLALATASSRFLVPSPTALRRPLTWYRNRYAPSASFL